MIDYNKYYDYINNLATDLTEREKQLKIKSFFFNEFKQMLAEAYNVTNNNKIDLLFEKVIETTDIYNLFSIEKEFIRLVDLIK